MSYLGMMCCALVTFAGAELVWPGAWAAFGNHLGTREAGELRGPASLRGYLPPCHEAKSRGPGWAA